MRAETTFKLVGDLIGVDAVIVGPTGRAEVTLILDTAAVMTTVVPSIAESIGYSSALLLARRKTFDSRRSDHTMSPSDSPRSSAASMIWAVAPRRLASGSAGLVVKMSTSD